MYLGSFGLVNRALSLSRSPARRQRAKQFYPPLCGASKEDDEENSSNEIQDWRAFRAKLVQQQQGDHGTKTQPNVDILKQQVRLTVYTL